MSRPHLPRDAYELADALADRRVTIVIPRCSNGGDVDDVAIYVLVADYNPQERRDGETDRA
jgi:hypothetical protein